MVEDAVDDDGQGGEGDIVHGEGQAVVHTLEWKAKGGRGSEERGGGEDTVGGSVRMEDKENVLRIFYSC